ncbi:uncharacterized protein METZ01_LOCUS252137, partial [marine metagenome]
ARRWWAGCWPTSRPAGCPKCWPRSPTGRTVAWRRHWSSCGTDGSGGPPGRSRWPRACVTAACRNCWPTSKLKPREGS